jgi:putative hemolysin
LVEIEKVADDLPAFELPAGSGGEFHTLAGFITERLGRIPKEGDVVKHGMWSLEVVDMDGYRVDKILAAPVQPMQP